MTKTPDRDLTRCVKCGRVAESKKSRLCQVHEFLARAWHEAAAAIVAPAPELPIRPMSMREFLDRDRGQRLYLEYARERVLSAFQMPPSRGGRSS